MKKFASFLSLAVFFLVIPSLASAAELIRDFSVTVKPDGGRRLVFEESIEYDFGDADRHGIYRYIPEVYDRAGGTYNYHLQVIGVWRDGQPEPYEVSRGSGNISLKIGRADQTITGAHTYAIRYATDRSLGFFPDHDELYWNVTGNGWQVPIERASLSLRPPAALDIRAVTAACFTGAYGSTEAECAFSSSDAALDFRSARVLQPYEGLTVVLGFPVSTFPAPTLWDKVRMLLADNFALFLPLIAFAVMFWRWWTKGKDAKLNTIIPEYEPPRGFTPAMVGAAMKTATVPDRTVTATIIDLARRGFLKIDFGEKKGLFGTTQTFTFVRQEKGENIGLQDYEQTVFTGLFKGGDRQSVDDLKDGKFYSTVTSFKSQVAKHLTALKLFDKNPTLVRTAYIVIAAAAVFLGFFISQNALGSFSAVTAGLIVAVFGWVMPRRTAEGTQVLTDIEGFKWFLSVTEKDRMDFHNAPERTPEQFQALLPYAIVFGVENKWAAQFASMHLPPPDWATGNVSSMNAVMLASSLGSMHSAASSAAFSPPSSAGSGGSGFSGGGSGGGGGGGGGGSW